MVRAPHRHKTATVNLHGNHYEVDTALVGRWAELVFNPFDLTGIQVRWQGRAMGGTNRGTALPAAFGDGCEAAGFHVSAGLPGVHRP